MGNDGSRVKMSDDGVSMMLKEQECLFDHEIAAMSIALYAYIMHTYLKTYI